MVHRTGLIFGHVIELGMPASIVLGVEVVQSGVAVPFALVPRIG